MDNPLHGDVRIPGIGEVPRAAVAAGLAVTGYLIWRHRQEAAATTAPAAGDAGSPADDGTAAAADGGYPWDGTYGDPSDPYSMDPQTGVTYGTEGGYGGGGGGGDTTGPPFGTNSEWSQYVLSYWSQGEYADINARATAIAKYLAGRAVDAREEDWVNEAVSIAGKPPVTGAGGYPPSIRVTGTKTGGKTYAANPVTGLTAKVTTPKSGKPSAEIRWHASAHATTYQVTITTGKKTVHKSETSKTTITVHGLDRGHEYDATVLARPARSSAHSASHRFRA